MTPRRIVLIGAGQASAVAARTLRRRGYDGHLLLVGDETDRPYQRPPLSKEYLSEADDSGLYLLPESWTQAQDVEVRTGVRALKVSAAAGEVLLDDGTSLAADRVLVATGGRARRLPDTQGDRIHYLRTRADADRLRRRFLPGSRVLVIGAGFVGAEVASTAVTKGARVTVLEAAPVPLSRVLGEELGAACARLHRRAGVDLRVGTTVEQVRQVGDEVVVDTSAGTFTADSVVVGVGMVPNDELARDSGIVTGDGIHVDERCRTSVENVFAAGDVASALHPHHRTRVRVEHFDNASKQGAVAAHNMLGLEKVHDEPHWFWSDQYGANLQQVGHGSAGDDLVVRGDLDGEDWSAFFLREGIVAGAFAVNRAEDIMVARELITFRAEVSRDLLADTDTDLTEIVESL